MATGDNGLTAVSVARECGIISSNKVAYMAELIETNHNEKRIQWSKIGVPKSGLGRKNSLKIDFEKEEDDNHVNSSSIEETKNSLSGVGNMMVNYFLFLNIFIGNA